MDFMHIMDSLAFRKNSLPDWSREESREGTTGGQWRPLNDA